METGTIYSIICKVNGKRYIGQTCKSVAERWRGHLQESRTQSHRPLYRAINKYGSGMFTIREIESNIPLDKLSEREIYWIEQFDTYNNGYNLTTGGEQSYTIREDIRNKISSTMQGVVKSDEHIANIKASLKKNNVGFTIRGDGKHLRCKIRGIHVNTGEVVEFNSLTEACNELGLKNGNLSRGIKNGYVVGSYKWEKTENKTINNPIYGKCVLTGKVLHEFKSEREAAKVLGTGNSGGVRKSLKKPAFHTWKGCRWYYKQD